MKHTLLIATLVTLAHSLLAQATAYQQSNLYLLATVAATQQPQALQINQRVLEENISIEAAENIFQGRIQNYGHARRTILLHKAYVQETVAKIVSYDTWFYIVQYRRSRNTQHPETLLSKFIFKQPLSATLHRAYNQLDTLVTNILAAGHSVPGKQGHSVALRFLANALGDKLLGVADTTKFFRLAEIFTTPLLHLLAVADAHDGMIENEIDLLLYLAVLDWLQQH